MNKQDKLKAVINTSDLARLAQEYMFHDVKKPDIRDFVTYLLTSPVIYTINIESTTPMNDEVKTEEAQEDTATTPSTEETPATDAPVTETPAEEATPDADKEPADEDTAPEEKKADTAE